MKIKMYTKAICCPFEGTPYEKITCVAYDSIDDINMINGEDVSAIGKYSSMFAKAVSRKLTLGDLRIMHMNEPIDGISAHEELILRGVFGIQEKKWRAQREFFEFACRPRYNVERSAIVSAAHAVVEAMRLAGEDEETIRRYKRNFITPALRKHR